MNLEAYFYGQPVFNNAELEKYLKLHRTVKKRTRESVLSHNLKKGRLLKVRRNLYAVLPPGYGKENFQVDPFLVTSRLAEDSVIAYHTALEFYGKAYTGFHRIVYQATNPVRTFRFQTNEYHGVPFPKSLRMNDKMMFAVEETDRLGLNILVTTLERTFVDVLDRPDISGSWEEIWRSLEMIEFFNLDSVLEYVKLLGNATTAARVGFFLEQHGDELIVEEHYLEQFRRLKPRQPRYLDRTKRKPGKLVKEWNLIVSQEIIERQWTDVL